MGLSISDWDFTVLGITFWAYPVQLVLKLKKPNAKLEDSSRNSDFLAMFI
jgi:hypothetical protein